MLLYLLFVCLVPLVTGGGGDGETLCAQSSDFKIACFYNNLAWQALRPEDERLAVEKIDPFLCTHLLYRSIKVHDDASLRPFRRYDRFEFNDTNGTDKLRFTALKKENPKLKTLVNILSSSQSTMMTLAKSVPLRKTFIENILNFMDKFGFDGVDLDLRYLGEFTQDVKVSCKSILVSFIREIHEALRPKCLLLSAILANRKSYVDNNYDVAQLTSHLDMFSLEGEFFVDDNLARPHRALRPSKLDTEYSLAKTTIDWAVAYLLRLGAPANKMLLFVGTYGLAHRLANASEHDLWSQTEGNTKSMQYFETCLLANGEGGWRLVRVDGHQMPYIYKGSTWISYDDEESVRAKLRYARDERRLAGVAIMELSNDDHSGRCAVSRFPLAKAIKAEAAKRWPQQTGIDRDEPAADEAGLDVLDYLRNFGYLSDHGDLDSDEQLAAGLSQFQRFMNIQSAGNHEVNSQTAARMKRARCGNKDFYPHSSLTSAGKWLFNSSLTSKELSYRVANYPNQLRNRRSEVDEALRKAFDTWEAVVPIKFVKVDTGAHIDISFHTPEDDQICPGGPLHRAHSVPTILAHSFNPPARKTQVDTIDGDIHFNGQLLWALDETKVGRLGHSLLAAAVHQIGHSLGLEHAQDPQARMFPVANSQAKLDKWDTKQVQALYDPRKRFFEMNNRRMRREMSEYYGVMVNINSLDECASRALTYNINATLWNKQTNTCIFKRSSLSEGQHLFTGTGKHLADYDICDHNQDITELEKEAMLWLANGQCDLILQSDDWPVPGHTTYTCKMFEEDTCCVLLFRLNADEQAELTVDKLAKLDRARDH